MQKLLMAIIIAFFFAVPALKAQNLFPLGEFKFDPAAATINEVTKEGDRYGAGLFVSAGEKRNFIFWFEERTSDATAGHPVIKLDTDEKYNEALCSLKLDFSKMNTAAPNRACFMINPPIEMKQGKIYEATIYIKTETPGMKLAATLMSTNTDLNFKESVPELMWKPYTVQLATPANLKTRTAVSIVAIDIISKGIFWVGSIEVIEKDAAKK